MATFGCSDFLNHLEAWMEGDRHPDAEAHVRGCSHCRAVLEDMGAIQSAARIWSVADSEPPTRVWTSLRAQLEREGLIGAHRRGLAEWLGELFRPMPRPVLAGAYLAALIAVGFALNGPIHRQVNDHNWRVHTRTSTMPLGVHLDSIEQRTVSSLTERNPIVTASLHQNLAIVDNYIALCEESVRDEPQNEFARDYLYDAYHQKADLLAQMTERGEYGR
jgi:hypothetical protein